MIKLCKTYFVWFLFLVQPAVLIAQIVDLSTAQNIARQFYQNISLSANQKTATPEVSGGRVFSAEAEPAIYLVYLNSGGFVLLSADERAWPLLGFGFRGDTSNEMPPALQDWIDGWLVQIQAIRRDDLTASDAISTLWEGLKQGDYGCQVKNAANVAPLLHSAWGQHTFYNAMCPADPTGPGGHALAGCVAIALSQVIFYYRYPETGSGSHGYYSDYGYEFADYGNTTYHWNNMVNSIYGMGNPDIAQLVYQVGVSVEMDYGASGSGALTQDGVDALVNYFRYAPDARYLPRFDAPDTFKDSLVNNLNQNRPCVFRGGGLSSSHAFVCDGVYDSLYFHFNWGWNGDFDGYFHIDNLNPWVYDFNFNQGAIIHIYPYEDYPGFCVGDDTLATARGTFTDGSGAEDYQNSSSCSWLIGNENKEGEQVMLWFPAFDLEEGKDFVYVYDGENEGAPLLGQVTGKDPVIDFLSSGETLFVVFESDAAGQAPGFQAEWVTINGPWCNDQLTMTALTKTWFSDASGPYPYASNSDCIWHISPQGDEYDSIQAVFVFFHNYELAQGDTLFFYDAKTSVPELITAFTQQSEPDTVFACTNKLKLNFKTDDNHTADGWGAGYGSIFPVYCSDTLFFTEKTGIVSDGSGVKNYINNSNCFFDLYNEEAVVYTLTFTEFEMEWGYDRLHIYDLQGSLPVLVKTLWGNVIPEPIVVETNHLLLNFVTDYSTVFKGWTLEYNALAPGISSNIQQYHVQVYPNPAHEKLFVSLDNIQHAPLEIRVFNLFSEVVFMQKLAPENGSINHPIRVAQWPAGIYFMQINSDNAMFTQKFIKQ